MIDFGSQLLQVYQTDELIGIFRTSLVEAERFPRLARTVYEKGPGRAASYLTRALEDAKARGEIQVIDCASVANHFVSMIRGNQYLKVVLGLRAPLTGSEANAFVKSAVDLCLYGIVAPNSPKRKKLLHLRVASSLRVAYVLHGQPLVGAYVGDRLSPRNLHAVYGLFPLTFSHRERARRSESR